MRPRTAKEIMQAFVCRLKATAPYMDLAPTSTASIIFRVIAEELAETEAQLCIDLNSLFDIPFEKINQLREKAGLPKLERREAPWKTTK